MTKFLKTSALLACILSSFAITAHAESWQLAVKKAEEIDKIKKLLISNPEEGQARKVKFCTEFKNDNFCKQ
jgi:hypothetical protein